MRSEVAIKACQPLKLSINIPQPQFLDGMISNIKSSHIHTSGFCGIVPPHRGELRITEARHNLFVFYKRGDRKIGVWEILSCDSPLCIL